MSCIRKAEDLVEYSQMCKRYPPEVALNVAKESLRDYFQRWGYRNDWIFRKRYQALSPAM